MVCFESKKLQKRILFCDEERGPVFCDVGTTVAGILAYSRGIQFRFAALIPPVCFSLGAAGGHIYQMVVNKNFSPGNAGLVLPIDIIIPAAGIYFLMMVKKYPAENL
jgi:Family of unknown function (DUF6790)